MLGTFLFLLACVASFYAGRISPESLPRHPDAYTSLLLESSHGVYWKQEGHSDTLPAYRENVSEYKNNLRTDGNKALPSPSSMIDSSGELDKTLVPIHMVQVGKPRTATTVQSKIMCVSLFMKLLERDDDGGLARNMTCAYSKKPRQFLAHHPLVLKTHGAHELEALEKVVFESHKHNVWVFSTAKTKEEAKVKHDDLQSAGYQVKFVQDLETLGEMGHHIVQKYASYFRLSDVQTNELIEYMRYWDILRVCCGAQMSKKRRNELHPPGKNQSLANDYVHAPTYHACSMYDMDEVERLFRSTTVYNVLRQYPNMRGANRLSEKDGELFGSYCSQYNDLVRKEGIAFNKKVRIRPRIDNARGQT